jgi:hypothetical protein
VEVFIGNLPGQATFVELRRFLGDLELHANFDCCRGRDALQQPYYYFIARTKTEDEGWDLIERLDGLLFLDKELEARPFLMRKKRPCAPVPGGGERRVNPDGVGEQLALDF